MALITCPECSSQVSDTAFKCPQCAAQLRTPKRGFWGKLFKWGFIVFNVIMVVWLVGYWMELGEMTSGSVSDAERTGQAIGGTIGTGLLLVLWVMGDIILGFLVLFTRPKAA
ncbi:hypothetical protein [Fodinicurvata fenggangensis]|uniref:hypothetical protein n=1 Tax=Fodinicurvata fenggangensis TaxID=1121830 RepID=UPI00047E1B5C|nr:hypothetical protein [Fodinicurvata fenggangensis]